MDIKIRKYRPPDDASLGICIGELKKFESQFDPDYLVGKEPTKKLLEEI